MDLQPAAHQGPNRPQIAKRLEVDTADSGPELSAQLGKYGDGFRRGARYDARASWLRQSATEELEPVPRRRRQDSCASQQLGGRFVDPPPGSSRVSIARDCPARCRAILRRMHPHTVLRSRSLAGAAGAHCGVIHCTSCQISAYTSQDPKRSCLYWRLSWI